MNNTKFTLHIMVCVTRDGLRSTDQEELQEKMYLLFKLFYNRVSYL